MTQVFISQLIMVFFPMGNSSRNKETSREILMKIFNIFKFF